MASMRDIKRRIKSVNSTQQITKAMNLVASSKLQKARQRLDDTREFFEATREAIGKVMNASQGITNVYFREGEGDKSLVIVIAGDRGLCGGYNSNVCKEAFNVLKEKDNSTLITIGNKSREYFKRRNFNISQSYTGISESPDYEDAKKIGQRALDMFLNGEVKEIYLAYTQFKSTLSHEPVAVKLLPVDAEAFKVEEKSNSLNLYEPSEEEVLDYIIPKYVTTHIYGSLVESSACELGARMTAMDSATENADEMIGNLTLLYNRARQGAITQEITEIVSGANALE